MSRKLPPINDDEGGGKMIRNKKTIAASDLKKLNPKARSRYLAYEEPPKDVEDARIVSVKRLLDNKKRFTREHIPLSREEEEERDKHAKLIGQLKAAEARNRLRIMRLKFQANRAQEISHLIACQTVALKAVRLQALVPPFSDMKDKGDQLDKFDRKRVEALLEDNIGLLTNRIS